MAKHAEKFMGNDMPIQVYYDDTCAFCRFWVQWLKKSPSKEPVVFYSLNLWREPLPQKCESVIVVTSEGVYQYGKAVMVLLRNLKGWRKMFFYLSAWLPLSWLNKLYCWIAKHRYWWG